ncbi:hypothetical protein ABVT39_012739 [Epinephelus coioides]
MVWDLLIRSTRSPVRQSEAAQKLMCPAHLEPEPSYPPSSSPHVDVLVSVDGERRRGVKVQTYLLLLEQTVEPVPVFGYLAV